MQGRSIRSFALDYYRKQGAQVRPLDGGEAFEIVPPEGQALTVTFTGDAEQPELMPLTSTSPQWRQILEDLTCETAVSYRYLVSGPIGQPAKTLEAAMPLGWTVESAKLLQVENRAAVGLTHRVTFDSPALNACQETIHHHVWEVGTGERLTALEPLLYELPCILFRPQQMPDEPTLQRLLAQSVRLIDEASELQGHEIERDLAGLLAEAEKRTNLYFDQQLANVLQREVSISEKLDAVIRKLGEAKSPEQITRYRQDGESLAQQLDSLKARREADLQAVESACLQKLGQEREKHELTAVTDLAAICHASYDILTYRAAVTSPEGRRVEWELRYWPVTKDLRFPNCPHCDRAMAAPVLFENGSYACVHCTAACEGCGTVHLATAFTPAECATCHHEVCTSCAIACTHCPSNSCERHVAECATCEAPICQSCVMHCATCEASLCPGHARREPLSGLYHCADHVDQVRQAIVATAELAAASTIAVAPAPEAEPLAQIVIEEVPIEAAPADLAPEVALEAEPEPEPEPVPFVSREPVVSRLSGKTLRASVAELCHACGGHYAVQEMVNCETCGVPSCKPCVAGDDGPCPACTSLTPTGADDPRIAFVVASFPALGRGRRRWLIAQQGPYIVVQWKKLLSWGLLSYHSGDDAPTMLTEFCNRFLGGSRSHA